MQSLKIDYSMLKYWNIKRVTWEKKIKTIQNQIKKPSSSIYEWKLPIIRKLSFAYHSEFLEKSTSWLSLYATTCSL